MGDFFLKILIVLWLWCIIILYLDCVMFFNNDSSNEVLSIQYERRIQPWLNLK